MPGALKSLKIRFLLGNRVVLSAGGVTFTAPCYSWHMLKS
jgi:hypothetical protein